MYAIALLIGAIFTIVIGFVAALIFGGDIQVIMTPVVIGTLLAILTASVTFFIGYRQEKESEKESPTLEGRITTLTGNLKDSLSVISEIETEIRKRGEIAEKLKNDVERYEQLKQLSQSQVEAIVQTVGSTLKSETRKSLWRNAIINFIIALGFFFLGWWIGSL